MTTLPSWIEAAADEIDRDQHPEPFIVALGREDIAEIIRKHVPRCKTCRHWQYEGFVIDTNPQQRWGNCDFLGIGRPDCFGCVEHEPREGQ